MIALVVRVLGAVVVAVGLGLAWVPLGVVALGVGRWVVGTELDRL